MSAFTNHLAAAPLDRAANDPAWPACEQVVLPGDGSLRWLGLLLLGGTAMGTFSGLYWLVQLTRAHF